MMATPSIAKMLMVLLALVASPVDDGEMLQVDFVDNRSIEQMRLERSDDTYTVFSGGDDAAETVATIERSGEGEDMWVIREGEAKQRTVDLGALLGDTKPVELAELAEADETVVRIGEEQAVRMKRSGKVLYLKSARRFVVAH